MSLSTELLDEFARRPTPKNEVFGDRRHDPRPPKAATNIFTTSQSAGHAPLSHPVERKLQGKSLAEQVRIIMADRNHFLREFPPRRVMDDRCNRVISIYAELQNLKYDIHIVTSFCLKHALALLESWKARNLARSTISNRWSTLRAWSLTINKHGMLGPLEEHWPQFEQAAKPVVGNIFLSEEQLQERSDFLGKQNDKTAYFVDRLHREVGLSREQALELDREAIEGIALGDDILRSGKGVGVRVYKAMAKHRELMSEAAQFMVSRNRKKLGWPELSIHDALAKYSVRLSYVNRTRFPDAPRVAVEGRA
ncbi:MAG: hypothetical protein Q7T78_11080 [Rhodoferax sp.]|nr:hypothetical protein [Rhodoferax sp.]